jgi:hypothetical protein
MVAFGYSPLPGINALICTAWRHTSWHIIFIYSLIGEIRNPGNGQTGYGKITPF